MQARGVLVATFVPDESRSVARRALGFAGLTTCAADLGPQRLLSEQASQSALVAR